MLFFGHGIFVPGYFQSKELKTEIQYSSTSE